MLYIIESLFKTWQVILFNSRMQLQLYFCFVLTTVTHLISSIVTYVLTYNNRAHLPLFRYNATICCNCDIEYFSNVLIIYSCILDVCMLHNATPYFKAVASILLEYIQFLYWLINGIIVFKRIQVKVCLLRWGISLNRTIQILWVKVNQKSTDE